MRSYVRAEDILWLFLFAALAAISPYHDSSVLGLIGTLAAVQIAERWIGLRVSIALKSALCWILIGETGGIASSFYWILLLPVITAATSFGVLGTTIVTTIASAEYLSFLLYLNWEEEFIPEDQLRELALRVLFLPVIGFLAFQLARARRGETAKLKEAVDKLSQAEAEVRRSERLAALGQLTAGLAHELRNPLGSIRTSAELLSRNVPASNEIAREMSANIVDEVDRTNSLVSRFLDFAKPQSLRQKPTDLETFLDGVVARFRRSHAQANVVTNYSPDVPLVSIDAEWMERVADNLLTNAVQASPAGATITIKTQLIDGGAEFAVIDRGSGIAPKDLESVFNPFFTTKPDGTGLGLAIVSKIVSEHGGRVAVESSPGEGTVVRVWLPC